MTPDLVTSLLQKTIMTAVFIMTPILVTAMVVGLMVSVFQTVTSLQEQTLTFLPKVMAVFAVVIFTFPWATKLTVDFMTELFQVAANLNR
ncbi:MAG: flagellar biosynthetic protein FliQ [Candidatus Anammoxibacter sp.]